MTPLTTKAAEIRAGLVADWRKAMEGVTPGPYFANPKDQQEVRLDYGKQEAFAYLRRTSDVAWVVRCSPAGISDLLNLIEQQAAELAREQTKSARRLACMDRRADRLIELTDALAKVKTEYDGLLSTWAESRERHLAAEARATTAESERDELLREKERLGAEVKAVRLIVDNDVRLMDPPDGGDPTTSEKVANLRRMFEAADRSLVKIKEAGKELYKWTLVIESAMHHDAPRDHPKVVAAIKQLFSALENGPAGLADAHSKSTAPSSQSERIAVLCPHAPTYDAGLCCGHPDDCTFVSPAALAPLGEE